MSENFPRKVNHPMNPYDEKRLRDEVIYLHYLWHQGPPQNPDPNPRKRPRPLSQFPTYNSQRVAASGSCPPPEPDNGADWSALVHPQPPSPSGWPEPNSKTDHHRTQLVSVEDKARFASLQMQSKVLESCKEFFNKRVNDNDGDDDDDEEEEEEEEEKGKDEKFLMEIFINNSELRGYYEENHEKGEFYCLVCGGIGENVGKKYNLYKGCAGLVQHCMSILKTKSKRGHRALGLVVCKVLGWNIDRLPVILLNGEPLSRTLANSMASTSQNALTDDGSQEKVGNIETVNSDVEFKEQASDCLEDDTDTNKNVDGLEISDAEPNKGTVNEQELGSSQITGAEWPCIEPQNATTSTDMGWPIFQLSAAPAVSAEEKIRFNMMQLQQNVFEACKQFFSTNAGSDIDEDEGDDDDEDEGDDDDEEDEGGCKDSKEFNFFSRLFAENNELRSYYETNFRGGEFCCLVCCGIGKKVWRTFKDCVGLLQHSTAISKTKRKRAHRAFGLVICDIIGWDIVCLPSIVQKSEPLSCSVEDLSEFPLDGRAWGNKDESGAAMDRRDSESSSKEDVDPNHNSNVNSENSMNGEASKGNDLENRTSNTSANQEKAVDSLNSPLENNTQPKSDDIQAESSSVPEPKEDAHNLKEEPSSNPETI